MIKTQCLDAVGLAEPVESRQVTAVEVLEWAVWRGLSIEPGFGLRRDVK